MPDQPATPAPAAAPAAPGAPSQQPVTIAPSDAGRTLAQLRNSHREALKGAAPADPKGSSSTSTTSTLPAAGQNTDASSSSSKAPTADDDEIAVLIEAQRAHKKTAAELDTRKADLDQREAALKEHETHIPAIRAAREAMKGGDIMGALHAVFGKELVTRDVFWAISKHIDEHGEEGAPAVDTKAEFERLYRERQEAEKAEADKKTADARASLAQARDSHDAALGTGFGAGLLGMVKTVQVGDRTIPLSQAPPEVLGSVVAGYATYVQTTMAEFTRDAAKYPAIGHFKPPVLRVVEMVEKLRTEKGQVPATTDVLKAIEDDLAATIRATPYGAPAAAAPRPITSVSSSWQRDEGTPPPPADAPKSVDEIREAHRQALRARATG